MTSYCWPASWFKEIKPISFSISFSISKKIPRCSLISISASASASASVSIRSSVPHPTYRLDFRLLRVFRLLRLRERELLFPPMPLLLFLPIPIPAKALANC
jgi:hypothetical protein